MAVSQIVQAVGAENLAAPVGRLTGDVEERTIRLRGRLDGPFDFEHLIVAQQDGRVAEHVPVPDGRVDARLLAELAALSPRELIVTPWRTVVVPDLENT